MHRRLILAGLAATGGLLTSAFLQVAVAAADAAADVSATGADAFTIGGYTFDPLYDVLNLGGGFENVYEAIPGATSATDTVIDAAAPLDPGDAFTAGLDAASAATTSIDPLAFLGF